MLSMNGTRVAVAAVLLGVLCGCTPGANIPQLPQYIAGGYRLGSGDQVRIITFGEDQLTGEFTVDDQGKIALPLVGVVMAAGQTPEQLGQSIAAELNKRQLVRGASVAVQVIAYRPIFVLGEINKPGQYPYQPGMTMLTAVAVAGGFTYRAVEEYAADVRTIDGKVEQGNVTPASYLAPGDVVKVYQRRF